MMKLTTAMTRQLLTAVEIGGTAYASGAKVATIEALAKRGLVEVVTRVTFGLKSVKFEVTEAGLDAAVALEDAGVTMWNMA